MITVELIIASLRRSAILLGKNIWLLGWAFFYSLTAPVLLLGGTGLPILFWWLSGRYFEPGLLFNDPLAFILGHAPLVLFSLAGFTVGCGIYLLALLFYHGALTGVAVRGLAGGSGGTGKVSASLFFEEGCGMFAPGMTIATLVSLLPLLPMVILLLPVTVLSFNLAGLVTGVLDIRTPWVLLCFMLAVIGGVLTALCCWMAMLWYQFSLAAARVESHGGRAALWRAWRFFKERWRLVVCYLAASLLLGVLAWGVTTPFSMGGKFVQDWSAPLGMAMQIVGAPLGVVLSVFLDLWLKCALVALFVDNR